MSLDVIGNIIGHGATAVVYESFLEEQNLKVAVKAFLSSKTKDLSMLRDISTGTDERLSSNYTLTYSETFFHDKFQCVSMPLMETSLDKFLNPYIEKEVKEYFNDDVCYFAFPYIFLILDCFTNDHESYFGCLCTPCESHCSF
jgi:serine/threonine protein kinase